MKCQDKPELIETDPFTRKRIQEMTRDNHFGNNLVWKDIAEEFGKRVGFAVREGLPFEVAFEAAKEHYRVVGKCMIDIANSVQAEWFPSQSKNEESK